MSGLQDPDHLKSFTIPCEWCGNKWKTDPDGDVILHHGEDCAYVEHMKEGNVHE